MNKEWFSNYVDMLLVRFPGESVAPSIGLKIKPSYSLTPIFLYNRYLVVEKHFFWIYEP